VMNFSAVARMPRRTEVPGQPDFLFLVRRILNVTKNFHVFNLRMRPRV